MTGAAAAARPPWAEFWACQQRKWLQYDLLSTGTTIMMLTSNVLRASLAISSYQDPSTRSRLRHTQVVFAAAISLHMLVVWLMLRAPRHYAALRNVLTCMRMLTVSGIIIVSTPLPVFQAGSAAASSQWFILQFLGFTFRTGATFCVIQFLFYRMPWPYMAALSFTYAACSTAFITRGYCRTVISTYSSQQPHADLAAIQAAAAVLDVLVGQGQHIPEQGLQQLVSTHAEAVSTHAGEAVLQQQPAQAPWLSTASLIGGACSSEAVPDTSMQEACSAALLGQCQATTTTVTFGVTYLLVLLMITLERYSKWQYMQQQQQHQQQHPTQQQPQGTGPNLNSAAGGRHGSGQGRGVGSLADPYSAPSASAFLRLELLKLVVLADVPVLILWYALSGLLRPPLPHA